MRKRQRTFSVRMDLPEYGILEQYTIAARNISSASERAERAFEDQYKDQCRDAKYAGMQIKIL